MAFSNVAKSSAASDVFVCRKEIEGQLGEAYFLDDDDDDEHVQRKEIELQLCEAKKSLAEGKREVQAAAARVRALHAELEEVSW